MSKPAPRTREFKDRTEAGRLLAAQLSDYAGRSDVVVLGLPRGGVPVAAQVASVLDAPLDVVVVRKVGLPGQEELAMGAVASGGVFVRNEPVIKVAGVDEAVIARAARQKQSEVIEREATFRGARSPTSIEGKTVILVDDGIATGSTMRAAVLALRQRRPDRIVVAVPVAPRETLETMKRIADEVVCLMTPTRFIAVGLWYRHFDQTTDETVRRLLDGSS